MRVQFPSLTPLASDSTRARPVKRNYMNSSRALIFNTSLRFLYGGLAQLGERRSCKPEVKGSTPLSSTNLYRRSLMERQRISTPCYVGSSPTGDAR